MDSMKTSGILNYMIALAVLLLAGACAEEPQKPVLGDVSTFTPPVLMNSATGTPLELLPENATSLYEKFDWERTEYGISLSTNYALEIDRDAEFNDPRTLAESTSNTASVTVEQFNNGMLALGLPGFEEGTVSIRLRSIINGYPEDTLYSQVITRTATTYQNSECGSYCTVGIIGSATAGGWDTDTDMRLADPTRVDKNTWTITVYLNAGEVKFRALDDWAVNWGAADYPTGTGVNNGANIPIATAGYYKVTLNDTNGEYVFTELGSTPFGTVGIIGSGTAGGWDNDTDLTQDPVDPHVWTATVTLTDGEAKFRADDAWTKNWGSDTYPSGYGVADGPNIPVKAGTYSVWFNDGTGQYLIVPENRSAPYGALGMIGPATPGGWDSDTDLTQDPANPFLWSKMLTLTEGEAKFRADDDWAVNWGASPFPGGIGAQDGPNIPVKEGTYFVTFNTGTGEYYFLK
jgi:hypothetical protein